MAGVDLKQLGASGATLGQVPEWDGSAWIPATPSGTTFTSVKTTNYTATVGEVVRFDSSGGTFTVTLPASPVAGDIVELEEDVGDDTFVTVDGNGNNVQDVLSPQLNSTVLVGGQYTNHSWRYNGSAWRLF